jgi:hypothetical protein
MIGKTLQRTRLKDIKTNAIQLADLAAILQMIKL